MRKVLADMHVPPVARRWAIRVAIVLGIALAIAYLPWRVGGGGEQAERLRGQLAHMKEEARALEEDNLRLERDLRALRTDPQVIETFARDELGMVYPGELVLRVEDAP